MLFMFFFFKQKTAYEVRISDWSSDVCSSDLVKGISFVAHHGQSIGIIGHNGSGKSTLLRAIAGVMPTSGGRIWADGTASLLGVNAALMSELSGERNIVLGGLALGLSPREVEERFDEVVEFANIGDFLPLPMPAYPSQRKRAVKGKIG